MFKQMKVWLALTTLLSLLALGASCSKAPTNDAGPETPTAGAKKFATPADAGTVVGLIVYNGTPPAPKKIDTSADPVCGTANPNLSTEDTVVKDGKLANVFVYVKDGTTAD